VVARFKVMPYSLHQTRVEANPNTMLDAEIREMALHRPPEATYLAYEVDGLRR
jgi:hypothetical protein